MISEPELVGEEGEIPSGALDVVAPPDPVRRDPGRRPWQWALGGALVASAVWAGSLYGVQAGDDKTDLKGYALPDDLCTAATLTSLSLKYGKPTPEHRAVRKDPALDRAWCSVQLGGQDLEQGQSASRYSLYLSFALHKKVDPEPEFKTLATQKDWYDESESQGIKEISGLGERAFYIPEANYGTPGLEVLDGPVVLQMSINQSYDDFSEEEEYVEPPEPDFSGVRELMIEDMKVLMQDLKK
ncbi:hypothetical protein [Streptomyces sp. N35]|uniref:hypothetical protein n=1 Tax=Streptomyces sp. N35 TaxID=2795730 RepID=UPI0018F68442|nr:hypothetical protein [Streptomyces sp. N35]